MNTDELIEWFWQQFLIFEDRTDQIGVCQCGTERVIDHSDNPERMRLFMMVSVFIDQMVYTHFHHVYPQFQIRFRFPKLFSHSGGSMAKPSWFVYSYHGYDKKMNWDIARPIAQQLFTDCLKYLVSETKDQGAYWRFLGIAEKEIRQEFEPETAQKFLNISSGADRMEDTPTEMPIRPVDDFWTPIRAEGLFAGNPVREPRGWITKSVRGIRINLVAHRNSTKVDIMWPLDRIEERATFLAKFSEFEVSSREIRTAAIIEIPIFDFGRSDIDRWDEIRTRLVEVGTAAFNILSQPTE
jgi:hypothetical protein